MQLHISNCWSNKISSRLLTRYVLKWMPFLKMVPMKLLLLLFVRRWLRYHIQQKDLEIIPLTLFLNKIYLNHFVWFTYYFVGFQDLWNFGVCFFNLTHTFCPRFPNLHLCQIHQVIWCFDDSEPTHFVVRQSVLWML